MDELEKRRRLLADPMSAIKNHASLDDSASDSLDNQDTASIEAHLTFEQQLARAMHIPVATELADQILLNQRIQGPQSKFKLSRIKLWSIAASLVIVSSVALLSLNQNAKPLSEMALAHVYHEPNLLEQHTALSPEQVKAKLIAIGYALPNLPDKVTSISLCGMGGEKALHLVAEIEGKLVTLLVSRLAIDPASFNQQNRFADNRFSGAMRLQGEQNFIVIAEQPQLVEKFYRQLGAEGLSS